MKRGTLIILLIDDDDNERFFFEQATRKSGAGHTLRSVRDAYEATRYLRGHVQYADRQTFPLPNVILCDLKMPGMNGFEFLQWVRNHPECYVIPTLIFSNSALEADVRKAYQLGASSFITKPFTVAQMSDLLRVTYDYWSRCECPALPAT